MVDKKTKLLPPILEDYLCPQIVDSSSKNNRFKIEFYMPIYNEIIENKLPYVQIVIKDIYSNQNLYSSKNATGIICNFTYDASTRKCLIDSPNFSVLNSNFNNVNTLYQIQLRFVNEVDNKQVVPFLSTYDWEQKRLDSFSEWSKVSIYKAIYDYTDNWAYKKIESNVNGSPIYITYSPIFTPRVEISPISQYENKNLIEYIDEYKFTLISMTSGVKDTSNWIKNYNKENTIFEYNFKYLLLEDYYYQVRIDFKTINGYEGSFYSFVHAVFQSTLPPNYIDFDSSKESPLEMSAAALGHVKITAYWNKNINEEDSNLSFVLYRSDISSKFLKWDKILKVKIPKGLIGDSFSFYDKSIESGVWYRYAGRLETQENETDGYISKTYFAENTSSEKYSIPDDYPVPIMCISEAVDIIGNNEILPITLNAKINSFSIKTADSTTETLGSAYPFVKRNGVLKYKQFQLSGLISYHMDEYGLFHSESDMYGDFIFLYSMYNELYNINDYNNIIKEREYRKKVIDFLTDGQPKLFRSPTEGNIIIKLTNVSFTPNETLGRMIYDFSATAIEIAECNYQNCVDLNILDINIDYNQPTIKILGIQSNGSEILAETKDGRVEPVYGLDLLTEMDDDSYSIKATQNPSAELDIIE